MPPYLNDDVLVLILNALAAPAYSLEEYLDLHSALLNLCLVSRLLCRLAQPLLGEQLCLRTRRQLRRLWFEDTITSRTRRCIIAHGPYGGNLIYNNALKLFPNLVDVRCESNAGYLHLWRSINPINLRRLELAGVELQIDPENPVVLRHLEMLRLSDITLAPRAVARCLKPAFMPSLRVLELVRIEDLSRTRSAPLRFAASLDQELLRQLDLVHWVTSHGPDAHQPDDAWATSTTPPFLFDYPSSRTSTFPRHLLHTASHTPSLAIGPLATFIVALQDCAVYPDDALPRVLILPRRILGFRAEHRGVAQLLDELEGARAAIGGRIIWYGGDATTRGVDVAVPEFCQYARALRAAR